MLNHLEQLHALRHPATRNPAFFASVQRVKHWQHLRLANTYADLSASPRFGQATAFFLDELYGDKDSAIRDRDLLRMYPTMKRLLPRFAFDTVTSALALDVLSEEFDQALGRELHGVPITAANYAAAFAAVGKPEARAQQVVLMREVGEGLDLVVKKPLIFSTLKMLRRPAKLAGLAEMQAFLEAGFTAFRHMKGATPFLSTIAERETTVIEALMMGDETWETLSPAIFPRDIVVD